MVGTLPPTYYIISKSDLIVYRGYPSDYVFRLLSMTKGVIQVSKMEFSDHSSWKVEVRRVGRTGFTEVNPQYAVRTENNKNGYTLEEMIKDNAVRILVALGYKIERCLR